MKVSSRASLIGKCTLLLLSLRSLPPEFKMSLSASLSATSLIGLFAPLPARKLLPRNGFRARKPLPSLGRCLFGRGEPLVESLLTSLWSITPSLIARSDPEPIGIAPFLPIIRSSCPLSSSTGSLVVVLSEQTRFRSQYSIFPH